MIPLKEVVAPFLIHQSVQRWRLKSEYYPRIPARWQGYVDDKFDNGVLEVKEDFFHELEKAWEAKEPEDLPRLVFIISDSKKFPEKAYLGIPAHRQYSPREYLAVIIVFYFAAVEALQVS
jgi:hypothetical protein